MSRSHGQILVSLSTAMNDERRRLSATWLNTIASGVVSAGTCGSLLAYSFGSRPGISGWDVAEISACAIGVGLTLHLVARTILSNG